jgi:hypothetical protein
MLPQVQQMMVQMVEKTVPPEMQRSQDRARVVADLQDLEKRLFDWMKDRIDFAR